MFDFVAGWSTGGLVISWMPPVTVDVNMLKVTNALKAFVSFGFQEGLLICVFIFICSRSVKMPTEANN